MSTTLTVAGTAMCGAFILGCIGGAAWLIVGSRRKQARYEARKATQGRIDAARRRIIERTYEDDPNYEDFVLWEREMQETPA